MYKILKPLSVKISAKGYLNFKVGDSIDPNILSEDQLNHFILNKRISKGVFTLDEDPVEDPVVKDDFMSFEGDSKIENGEENMDILDEMSKITLETKTKVNEQFKVSEEKVESKVPLSKIAVGLTENGEGKRRGRPKKSESSLNLNQFKPKEIVQDSQILEFEK